MLGGGGVRNWCGWCGVMKCVCWDRKLWITCCWNQLYTNTSKKEKKTKQSMTYLAMCRAPKQRLGASLCRFLDLEIWGRLTCDIWGLKLISFRSTDPGERLCNIWHRSTPSRRACAKSKTAAEGHTTRWFGGRTLQSINHRPHCLHSSMVRLRRSAPRKVNRVFGDRLIAAHRPVACTCAGCVFHSFTTGSTNYIFVFIYSQHALRAHPRRMSALLSPQNGNGEGLEND